MGPLMISYTVLKRKYKLIYISSLLVEEIKKNIYEKFIVMNIENFSLLFLRLPEFLVK